MEKKEKRYLGMILDECMETVVLVTDRDDVCQGMEYRIVNSDEDIENDEDGIVVSVMFKIGDTSDEYDYLKEFRF